MVEDWHAKMCFLDVSYTCIYITLHVHVIDNVSTIISCTCFVYIRDFAVYKMTHTLSDLHFLSY